MNKYHTLHFGQVCLSLVIICAACSNEGPEPDQVILINGFDAENDWGIGWSAEGDAFLNDDQSPNKPPRNGWEGRIEDASGASLVDTFVVGDGIANPDEAMGRLISPEILIERRYLNFLIEGGTHTALSNRRTTVEIFVNDELVHFYTGDGDFPLSLQPRSVDLSDWPQGALRIEIIDQSKDRFGFISADLFVLADAFQTRPDVVLANFEDPTALVMAGWMPSDIFAQPSGVDAWAGTSRETNAARARAIGERALSTCEIEGPGTACATPTGTLVSPSFEVTSRYLNFAVVGGDGVQDVGIEVLEGEDVLASFRPSQCRKFLSCDDDWRFFDLQAFIGRQVQLRIFDNATSGCGFISVDHVYLSSLARGSEAITELRETTDQINVTVPAGGFDNVVADFDDPQAMLDAGWSASGVFASPVGTLAWEGTTSKAKAGQPGPARVGIAAVSTCEIDGGDCDSATGELLSPLFEVTSRYLNFLMAGGNGVEDVGLEIIDQSGQVLIKYTTGTCSPPYIDGDNDWRHLDMSALLGEMVQLRLFDRSTTDCGFVSFDHFYQSDALRGGFVGQPMRPMPPTQTNVDTSTDAFENVISSFEDPIVMLQDGGWEADGDFLNPADANGWTGTSTDPNAAHIFERAVSTCQLGGSTCDAPTGALLSPLTTVVEPYWSFLMSGGNGIANVGLQILDARGDALLEYRPSDCDPSYINDNGDWHTIDMSAYVGQQVRLRLFDESTDGCGFVSFDHFYQSGEQSYPLVGTPVAPPTCPMSVNVTVDADAFDNVISGFEDPVAMVAGGWTPTGAFEAPADARAWSGTTVNEAAAHVGCYAVSTCEIGDNASCDAPTGSLTSPPIDVDAPFWNFLMAGGDGSNDVGLDILDEAGRVVASFSPTTCSLSYIDGDDDWYHIDMTAFVGEQVRLRLRDDATGGCGFLSFDHFYQSTAGRNTLAAVAVPSEQSAVNVTTSTDAFDRVIGNFDDANHMLATGWTAFGDFADPTSADAWVGTSTINADAARVGLRAVSTCELGGRDCDGPTGALVSPRFNVSSPYLSFLMSGGDGSADVGIQVLDSSARVIAAYRPSQCSPSYVNGDDDWHHIDLSAFIDEQVQIRIFDAAEGGCGFVGFDHVYLSGQGRGDRVSTAIASTNASLTADAFIRRQLIADFDDPQALASNWTATGAFADPTTPDAWAGTARVTNMTAARIGAQAVSTCEIGGLGCDSPTGELTSPPLTVDFRYLNFMMAGGNGSAPVGVEVLDGANNVVGQYIPNSCGPSHIDGDEDWHWIDLGAQLGNTVRIRIFDREPGGCGFVSFDHFYLSDAIRGPSLTPQTAGTVLGDFDDAQAMIASGWVGSGVFSNPAAPDAWTGISRRTTQDAARVGQRAVSTCEIGGLGCDAPTGELRSPLFTVNARYLNFAMSGGNGMAPVGLEVLDATDSVIARFQPDQCGPPFIDGRDDWHHIDLVMYAGQQIRLRIFDEETGGCGFVSFDHFFFSNTFEGRPVP